MLNRMMVPLGACAATAAVMLGMTILGVGEAHAAPMGDALCEVLDMDSGSDGFEAVAATLLGTGMRAQLAANVITDAVRNDCPEHTLAMYEWARK